MSATEVLSALDRIHGTVSVIGSMNADYTVTAQRLPGPGETITGGPLQLLPGGKSGNQAAAAARIGATGTAANYANLLLVAAGTALLGLIVFFVFKKKIYEGNHALETEESAK